ncbi:uncharacterized protein [Coffea arabica]|uniref:Retrovirus-related Pol polyprotein from transposon TNT 1-94-like beta-barrel domain-containing protein n=1 Tax=Coffea arabica TaxID=13443 RepID=A0ABM4V9C8_COFAR
MEAYLGRNDLWEPIEDDYEVLPLLNNPTIAQMKHHNERRQRKSKVKASLHAIVTSTIFSRIMTLKTAHEIWNFLKNEYEGDEKIKGMRVLNLIREFEMQKMKGSETIKDYSDRLLDIVNKVRLLGTNFFDSRIVQKILVTIPEKFEATTMALENSKDLSCIILAELLNALQAQEQRRLMRQEESVEDSCFATNSSVESWLIDSGSTKHMTYDQELFKKLDKTAITRVWIGNGDNLAIKGIGHGQLKGTQV